MFDSLDTGDRIAALNLRYGHLATGEMLKGVMNEPFAREMAVVSSFGTESAVLLHLVASASKDVPIIFIDTGRHFGETKRYRDQLVECLGLRNLRVIEPRPDVIAEKDPKGLLWNRNPDLCCYWRKTEPMERALDGFSAWISGRKRFQASTRKALPLFEEDKGRIKINPLYGWSKAEIDRYFAEHDLPRHPLEADGFLSIGCLPCTDRVTQGEDVRAGRWRGLDKTECGIHVGLTPEQRAAMGDGI